MDDHDRELLAKQTRHLQPPPRRDGLMMLILVGVFLAGATSGSVLFGGHSSAQIATNDGKTALAFFFDGNHTTTR
jgi:hypothetical protein